MLSVANLTMQFGPKPLFENVSVKFNGAERYGLIGANGVGKSTFLKMLSGATEPTSGQIIIGPSLRVASLGQDQFAFEEYTAVEAVMRGYPELWETHCERERLYSLPEMSEEDGIKAAEIEVKYAELDGYAAISRAEELLAGVGIAQAQHHAPMSEIAPGLKIRVLLTQVLFANPDIMLLDEPTNNLDIDTIRWLENELQQRQCLMIIVSHDRHFLNSVCTHMADLDYGEMRLFPGNYDEYMQAAAMVQERLRQENAKKQAKIKELQTFVNRFSANASKAKQATSRARQLEKIKLEDIKPSSRRSPYIRFNTERKLQRFALQVENLANGYDGNLLFDKVSFAINAGEKVAIIGPNGIGKTTLAKTLIGEVPKKTGEIKWPEHAKYGYFPQQHHHEFELDDNLMEWIAQWRREGDDEQSLRSVLGRMLFSGDDIKKKVRVLSGGERARMLFGKLILTQPNILLLDEPTNHLDMESIEALNYALEQYDGTVIFISHDRQLVSSLATRIFALTSDGFEDFKGTYEEYLASKELR